jgi:hypothetical protein
MRLGSLVETGIFVSQVLFSLSLVGLGIIQLTVFGCLGSLVGLNIALGLGDDCGSESSNLDLEGKKQFFMLFSF